MKVPLEIAFKGIRDKRGFEALIRQEAAKLEKVCDYISSCRVIAEKRQYHREVGNPYRIRIDMTVPPGHELVVKREPSGGDMHDPVAIVIKRAFDAAVRQLRKLVEQQRGAVKTHPVHQVMAVVHRLLPAREYGFLRTVDTLEDIYFHKNIVLHHDFEHLVAGMGVRYAVEQGEKGLQATSVQVVDKPRTPVELPSRG